MSINNIALNAYQTALEMGKTKGEQQGSSRAEGSSEESSFASAIADSLGRVNDLQIDKENMIAAFASGETENVHELMISLQKAGLALKMTSAVRNKVMEAYKELSKMTF